MNETFLPFEKDNNQGDTLRKLLLEEGFNIYYIDIGEGKKRGDIYYQGERICSFKMIDGLVKEGYGAILIAVLKEAIEAGKALEAKEKEED